MVCVSSVRAQPHVDVLDIDTAVLHHFKIVRDLDQLACGDIGISEGATVNEQILLDAVTRYSSGI